METYRRDFFMHRVICGYLKYKYDNDLELYIHEPDSELLYEAQHVYTETYEDSLFHGVLSETEMNIYLSENYLWTEMEEYQLTDEVPKTIEDLKIELYNNLYDDMRQMVIRLQLEEYKRKLNKLYLKKHSYTHFTCGGIATLMKQYYITQNSTKLKNGENYNWSRCSVLSAMYHKDSNTLLDSDIRDIAKYDGWKAIWQTSKKNGGLFKRYAVDMTDEQKRLTFWSMFYDNIHEHPDCPPDAVLEDDDMIDGWAIMQRRERDKDKGQKNVENKLKNDRIKNAGEVFVIAKTEKEAAEIESLNAPHIKALKQARFNQLEKNKNMNESSFADVKQKLYMDAVNKGNQIMKGR